MTRFKLGVGVATLSIWALAFVDALITGNTILFGFVTPVMLVIVTALFALNRNGKNGNGH